jgi:hypothetical protein
VSAAWHRKADDFQDRPFEDADDPGFPALAPAALQPGHHPVAVPGVFEVGGFDEDVFAPAIRGQEAEAVRVHAQAPAIRFILSVRP